MSTEIGTFRVRKILKRRGGRGSVSSEIGTVRVRII